MGEGSCLVVGLGVALNVTITTTATVVGINLQPWYTTYLPSIVGMVGALLGVYVGHHLGSVRARNERLYEGIYRPLLGQIGLIREEIEKGLDPNLRGIEQIRRDGLFFFLKEKEKFTIEKVYRWTQVYSQAYHSAVARGRDIIDSEMKRQFLGDNLYADLAKQLTQGRLPTYRLLVGDRSRAEIGLLDSLVQKKNPYDALGDIAIISATRSYDCIIGSDTIPENKAKAISESALKVVEEDIDFKWLWSLRKRLVEDTNSLIGMLKRYV